MTPLEYMMRWEQRLRVYEEEAVRQWSETRDRVWLDAQRRFEMKRKEVDRDLMEQLNLS